MFTKPTLLLPALLLGVLLWGCDRGSPQAQDAPAELQPILQSVQDSAMAEQWKQAYEAGELPPLETLPQSGGTIDRATMFQAVADTDDVKQPPVFPEGLLAGVQPFSTGEVEAFQGTYTLTEVSDEKISGSLAGVPQPFELYFRLPNNQQLAVAAGQQLNLNLQESVVEGAMTRIVSVEDGSRIVLFHIADGSSQPYNRTFDDLGLTITQDSPTDGNQSSVTITYQSQRLQLTAGESAQFPSDSGQIEFLLQSSYYSQPNEVLLSEGFPFYVSLMAYRIQ